MAKREYTWAANAFDSIGIRTRDGKVTIKGNDGDRVLLENDQDDILSLMIEDRRLQIHASGHKGEAKFTLQLPKHKAWAIDLFSEQAQFKAVDILARMNLAFGKGEIQAENCRGALSVISGKANIHLKHFSEAETPAILPPPEEWPPLNLGVRESWPEWWSGYWEQLSGKFYEKILKRFFNQAEIRGQNPGINVQSGKADLQLEDIEASEFTVRLASGDVKLKRGKVATFDLNILRGDIECESCMPSGAWSINTSRGDIRLLLPADTRARLDVATRQGDIKSTTSMVRVTRQGPEAWHGGRMVGTMGTNLDGYMPEIHLNTLRGDINIETEQTGGIRHETQTADKAPSPVTATWKTTTYDTPLAVLNALKEGIIDIKEADRLLHDMDS